MAKSKKSRKRKTPQKSSRTGHDDSLWCLSLLSAALYDEVYTILLETYPAVQLECDNLIMFDFFADQMLARLERTAPDKNPDMEAARAMVILMAVMAEEQGFDFCDVAGVLDNPKLLPDTVYRPEPWTAEQVKVVLTARAVRPGCTVVQNPGALRAGERRC